ncbi:MAG TPA: UbiD family decarboxylase [Dehalococcoidia bacterium]|nr:UbiD family decarboxylase [Dehalococcoidia bacterium]
MAYKDVRSYIEALRRTGDLVDVTEEVDWDLEIGAIGRRAAVKGGPAVLFRNIKDYPGFGILENALASWRRFAITVGLAPDTPLREILDQYEALRARPPLEPIVVDDAPCKMVKITGEDIDLFRFPAPMLHEGDGGRYIGTWDIVVTRDIDGSHTNWGTYRFMLHTEDLLAGWPGPLSHLGRSLRQQYLPRKEPMPIAIVMGADPVCHIASATPYPRHAEEAAQAGGLRGEPVELIKCETSDLLVPAGAEIVIEGEVLPNYATMEGPYGEFPGYRSGTMGSGILVQVKAITHRPNPILTVDCTGYKDGGAFITSSGTAIGFKQLLQRRGFPVVDVNIPVEGCNHLMAVSVKERGHHVAEDLMNIMHTAGRLVVSKLIMVDADVDVFDLGAVLHALATKCHPGRGVFISEVPGKGESLTPYYEEAERAQGEHFTAVFDCTWPAHWDQRELPVKANFETTYSQEIQEKVLARWQRYGFE